MIEQSLSTEFCRIDDLLLKRDFAGALEKLRSIPIPPLDSGEYAYFCILLSEVKLYLSEYDVDELLKRAISYYKFRNENDRFARAKFLFGWMQVALGNNLDARESLLEAYAAYKRCDDFRGEARALNHLAYVATLSGEIEYAVNCIKQCIGIYDRLQDSEKSIAFSNNLAAIYYRCGEIKKSISEYRSQEARIPALGNDIQYHYYLRFSIALAIQGHIELAKNIASKINLLPVDYRRQRALYWEFLGAISLIEYDWVSAEKYLLKSLPLSLEIAPESDHISQTKRLLADAYLGLKKFDLAQKYAEEALVVAEKINERAEIAACYRVFARVALHDGKNDKAKEWFKRAMDLFAMIKSRYELAVTRYLYATSGLVDNNERIALLYMAKEYFESEEIKPYIDKVDSELSSLDRPKLPIRPNDSSTPVFIAASRETKKLLEKAEHFAPTDFTVLITGPTGVGKDQLAKYIHWASGRKGKYLSFNCASFPETMIESELFGYSAGAFTDARKDKPGLIELTEKGTLCLNEIAETPLNFQVKILDFLETKTIRRVGSTQFKEIDVRIIAATNQDLQACMMKGKFRSDLYFRLKQIEISIHSLSERCDDIPELVRHFLKGKGFDFSRDGNADKFKELCAVLSARDWPGNIRELENYLKVQSSISGNNIAGLLEQIREFSPSDGDFLFEILNETNWNQSEAARRLNLTEGGLRYRMSKLGIIRPSDK